MLLAANDDAPFKSVAELIAWSKVPGRIVPYASPGVGSLPHLWGEYLKARTGMPLEHVGYKGSAEALRDVMAGHVPLFSDVLMPTAAPIRAGKLRGLTVAMAARSPLLPDVPTVGEVGLTGMEAAVPFGISTTGGTPPAVVERLNAAVNEALGDPSVRQKLLELGFIPVGGTAAFYAKAWPRRRRGGARSSRSCGSPRRLEWVRKWRRAGSRGWLQPCRPPILADRWSTRIFGEPPRKQ